MGRKRAQRHVKNTFIRSSLDDLALQSLLMHFLKIHDRELVKRVGLGSVLDSLTCDDCQDYQHGFCPGSLYGRVDVFDCMYEKARRGDPDHYGFFGM